jgi:hypothetical protein
MTSQAEIRRGASGLQILKVCKYNTELCAAIIALSDNWQEVLESIESPKLIEEVGVLVKQIRQGLGKQS